MRHALVTAALLFSALAFSQSSSTVQPPAAQQPNTQQERQQPAKAGQEKPVQPKSVADAARASKGVHDSTPPGKVYKNKDVSAPTSVDAGSGDSGATMNPPAKTPASRAAKSEDEILAEKDKAFEAQGIVLKEQILAQKSKIIAIQNQAQDLNGQLTAWNVEHHRDTDPAACWTSSYNDPYFKDWCAIGRNLQSAYDTAQQQLAQEKAHLEQMQEEIRRKGYGNGVYDPD
jgi:hypothetical protein